MEKMWIYVVEWKQENLKIVKKHRKTMYDLQEVYNIYDKQQYC